MNQEDIWGDINADSDREGELLKYNFVNTNVFYTAIEKEKYLLRGFKGSGKTAFVTKLIQCRDCINNNKKSECNMYPKFCEKGNFDVIYINADDDLKLNKLLSQYIMYKYREDLQEPYEATSDIIEIWGKICKELVFKGIPELKKDEDYQKFVDNTKKKRNNIVTREVLGLFERAFTRGDEKSLSDTIANYIFPDDEYFSIVEKKAVEILEGYKKKIYVIFDGFDHFLYDTTWEDKPKEKIKFIQQISAAFIELGYKFLRDKTLGERKLTGLPNTYIKILLPEDFIIDDGYIHHMRDSIKLILDQTKYVQLKWDKENLKKFVAARLYSFINQKPPDFYELNPDLMWKKVFAPSITTEHYKYLENSFGYVLRHTMCRPRDLQILGMKITKSFCKRHHLKNSDQFRKLIKQERIEEMDITAGVNEGARTLVQGLFSEFRTLPNLEELAEIFVKQPPILSYKTVLQRIEDNGYSEYTKKTSEEMIVLLYRIGFFGEFINGTSLIKQRYATPTYPLMRCDQTGEYYCSLFSFAGYNMDISMADKLVIAPVFWDELKIDVDENKDYLIYSTKPEGKKEAKVISRKHRTVDI